MHLASILRAVLTAATTFGMDELDTMGHPVVVVDQDGNTLGDVASAQLVGGTIHLTVSKAQ